MYERWFHVTPGVYTLTTSTLGSCQTGLLTNETAGKVRLKAIPALQSLIPHGTPVLRTIDAPTLRISFSAIVLTQQQQKVLQTPSVSLSDYLRPFPGQFPSFQTLTEVF